MIENERRIPADELDYNEGNHDSQANEDIKLLTPGLDNTRLFISSNS